MIEDEKIIDLFFNRSEKAIQELDIKYGKVCHKLSYNILNNKQVYNLFVFNHHIASFPASPIYYGFIRKYYIKSESFSKKL